MSAPRIEDPPPPRRALAHGARWRIALAGLSPAYFGMVMATGIVSIGSDLLGWPGIARGLFALNVAVYGLLWLLNLARLFWHRRAFFRDMVDHLRGPGFFTVVAATSVLGSEFLLLADSLRGGLALWAIAVTLWLALTYTIFTAFTIKEEKPTLDQGISGGWLLAVVATQSLAVLSALLAADAQPTALPIWNNDGKVEAVLLLEPTGQAEAGARWRLGRNSLTTAFGLDSGDSLGLVCNRKAGVVGNIGNLGAGQFLGDAFDEDEQ